MVNDGSTANAAASRKGRGKGSKGAAEARSPLQGGSEVLSVQQAADMVYQQLLQPNTQPSKADILQLLCATGSLGPELHAFDPVMVTAYKDLQPAIIANGLGRDSAPLWFAAALSQLQLREMSRDSRVLADITTGSGVLEEEYLRCG
jgi:hypothetical protein